MKVKACQRCGCKHNPIFGIEVVDIEDEDGNELIACKSCLLELCKERNLEEKKKIIDDMKVR